MTSDQLQDYLYKHIPLSKAMGVEVRESAANKVVLFAPLALNINHRDTVFGGSASALAILSAWSLLHLRLDNHAAGTRLVIQSNTMAYDKPIVTDFNAICTYDHGPAWDTFAATLVRKKRARIAIKSALECQAERVGRFEGQFVALISQ